MPGLSGMTGLSGVSGLFGGGFLPSDLSGLLFWIKSDTGLFQDTTKTSIAVDDGDVIGVWADQSGNENDAFQSVTARKPTLRLNVLNGRSVIRFDGVDDILAVTDNITDGTITVFCVLKKRVVDAGLIAYARTQKAIYGARSVAADEWGITLGGATEDSGSDVNSFTITAVVMRAANDADLVTNGNVVTVVPAGGFANNVTNIGANIIGNANFDGDISEFLIYDTPLSNANRELVETYLNGRYTIF